jgi:hypothetical protein
MVDMPGGATVVVVVVPVERTIELTPVDPVDVKLTELSEVPPAVPVAGEVVLGAVLAVPLGSLLLPPQAAREIISSVAIVFFDIKIFRHEEW